MSVAGSPSNRHGRTARGQAFGLDLVADFDCFGLRTDADRETADPVAMSLLSRDAVAGCVPVDAERIFTARRPDGRVIATFRHDPSAGFLLYAAGYGHFHVDAGAQTIRCGPIRTARWRWQRYLAGQVLPLAALLRGFEVFHASVAALDDDVVAFLGWSHAGKSTLLAALLRSGAEFVTDDVMAVAPGDLDAPPVAQPGLALMSLRHDALDALGLAGTSTIGHTIGSDGEAVRVALPAVGSPGRITDLYVIDRSAAAAARPLVEPIEPADPRILLGSSYNFVIRSRERLIRQLDVCARLARHCGLFRLNVPSSVTPLAVADAVRRHRDEVRSRG